MIDEDKELRVAAYCRVSTNHNDQANSFEAQQKYFYDEINKRPNWKFVDIYADKGLSGTTTKKRDRFNDMIFDALEEGKIDLIIIKEISRFARNTVDALSYVRKLKESNVYIFFLNDRIHTKDNDSELRLTIMASLAQEESRRTSQRVTWGMDRKIEAGYVLGRGTFGFHLNEGVLSINEDEAETVKLIFHMYVHDGLGQEAIAKELLRRSIPTGKFYKVWSKPIIQRILTNERYVGDLRQKKNYTPNFLDHKAVPNNIEDTFFLPNHHDAIIDRKTWDLAQEEMERRKALSNEGKHYTNRYWASGKLRCGVCGCSFVSRNRYNKDGSAYRLWSCKETYTYGKKESFSSESSIGCDGPLINDNALLECIHYALCKFNLNRDLILEQISQKLKLVMGSETNEQESISQCDKKIAKIAEKRAKLIDMHLDGNLSLEELNHMKSKYSDEIDSLNKRRELLLNQSRIAHNSKESLSKLTEKAKSILRLEEHNEKLYREILDKIIVHSGHNLEIYFKHCSIPIQLHYETSGRKATYHVECTDIPAK